MAEIYDLPDEEEAGTTQTGTDPQSEGETSPANTSVIAEDWILWEKLLNLGHNSDIGSRGYATEQSVDAYISGMQDDPAYQSDAMVEGVNTPIIASRINALECNIKALPGTNMHIGDLVEALEENWLVVSLYTDKIGILNGKMWICNDIINFQNHSSTVHTRYCVIDDGSYSREHKLINSVLYVPNNTYKLYLSMDPETIQMYIDKRLAFGEIFAPDGSKILETYKVTGIDIKSRNFGEGSHLMVMSLQRDVYDPNTDDIVRNLCDVYVEPQNSVVPALSGSCIIVGRDAIRIGTSRKYTAMFADAEGNEISDVTPIWHVSVPEGATGIAVSESFGMVTITVPLSEALIGVEITLSVTCEDGIYGSYEKKVQVITVG